MGKPDLSILALLLLVCCFLFYVQIKKGDLTKMNYYDKYRSISGYLSLLFL